MITKLWLEKFKMGYNWKNKYGQDEYFEVFENPTSQEIISIPDRQYGLRGVLNRKTGNIYLFHGDSIFHINLIPKLGFNIFECIALEFDPKTGDFDITGTTTMRGHEKEDIEIAENNINVKKVSNILRSIS
jgi:hypothetical protein